MANDQPERIDGFLRAELTIDPSDLLMDLMPGEGANRRQPKQVQFVLKVTNSSRTDYSTEHENSEIFRFWVSDARGNEVWRSPGTSLQVITPVRIDAGASTEGKGIWQIED